MSTRPQDGDVLDLGDGVHLTVVRPADRAPLLVLHVNGEPDASATARVWLDGLRLLVAAETDPELAATIKAAS